MLKLDGTLLSLAGHEPVCGAIETRVCASNIVREPGWPRREFAELPLSVVPSTEDDSRWTISVISASEPKIWIYRVNAIIAYKRVFRDALSGVAGTRLLL